MFTKTDFLGGLSMYNAKLMMVIDAGGSAAFEESLIREQNDLQLQTAIDDETNARQSAVLEIEHKLDKFETADTEALITAVGVEESLSNFQHAMAVAERKRESSEGVLQAALDEEIILRENAMIDFETRIGLLEGKQSNVLSTVPSTVNGSFWLDVSDSSPTLKILYGGVSYACPLSNLTEDPVTQSDINAIVNRS